MSLMADDGGPTKMTPSFWHDSANSTFSDKNPYPGWIAWAPVSLATCGHRKWNYLNRKQYHCYLEYFLSSEIWLTRGWGTNPDSLICHGHVETVSVRVTVHCNCLDAETLGSPHHSTCYLSSVGNQHLKKKVSPVYLCSWIYVENIWVQVYKIIGKLTFEICETFAMVLTHLATLSVGNNSL